MRRIKPEKRPDKDYTSLWRLLDGAIYNCILHHPEYFNKDISIGTIRNSLLKRTVGAAKSFVESPYRRVSNEEHPLSAKSTGTLKKVTQASKLVS